MSEASTENEVFDGYCVPGTREPLRFVAGRSGGTDGVLVAASGREYPVRGGVPRFVESDNYATSFGYEWKRHSRTQVDSHAGSEVTAERFFRGTGWPRDMHGERVLEAGCGSGRFSEVIARTGAALYSFDYSVAAEVTYANNRSAGVHVAQASIYEMPYAPASFDRVFCYGVLQHTPDVRRAFASLVAMVRSGGSIAVDVYDSLRRPFNARYRVRWLTRRIPHDVLYQLCERIIPLYMKVAPPLHPWNQLVFPLKDYRGAIPGLTREQEIEWSILDTFDSLSPEFDSPQSLRTMKRWCAEEGLTDVHVARRGNGIEVRARKPGGSGSASRTGSGRSGVRPA